MPLPIGSQYQKRELGNGTIGSYEDNVIDAIKAAEDIPFGVALDVNADGHAVVATKAPIFGIAMKRDYAIGDDFNAIKDDHYYAGERIPAVQKGGISVPITEDVNRYDQATVNTDGTGTFRSAKQGEPVVGRFITNGDANNTAIIQIALTAMGTTGVGTPANNPGSSNNGNSGTGGNNNPASGSNATDKKGDK